MKKIKVALFVCRMVYGGVEAVISNYMRNFDKDKFELHIITQDINDENCIKDFVEQGFIVHVVTHKRKGIMKNIRDTKKLFREYDFDIVHSHMTLANFLVLFLAKHYGIKVRISHSHNCLNSSTLIQKIKYGILRKLNCMPATDYYACGVDAGAFLFGEKNMKAGKVKVFKNAIDIKKYAFDPIIRNAMREKLGIHDKMCIGHVGRFTEQKNHTFLIGCFNDYHKINPESVLLLVGDGELKEEITEKINELGLSDSVIMTGNITNVEDYYQAMDVFLLPSVFEGLPLVSVEVQNCGLPCLISDKVDKRCKITENVYFLPIDSTSVWAEKINSLDTKNRRSCCEEIAANGYDIVSESEKLAQSYLSALQ